MKKTAIFIPEAFEDIFSTDQQSQYLSQKQLRNELMRPWGYDENFHYCQTNENFFFWNMKITAKHQRNLNYVGLHAWAILVNAINLRKERRLEKLAKDKNFSDPSYIYNKKVLC